MPVSLVDAWCPEPHTAALTAATADAASGRVATGDAWGLVCVRMATLAGPNVRLQHAAKIDGTLALSPGGGLLAVGDAAGTLAVYDPDDGRCIVSETADGGDTRTRAMRALAFAPDGERLASLASDGRVRLMRATTGERLATYADLSGTSLSWDDQGRRLVALDPNGTPVVLDLVARQRIVGPSFPGGAKQVCWVPGHDQLLVLGTTGLFLVDAQTMQVLTQRTADRSSGMLAIATSPDGARFAVISSRSVHIFEVEGFSTVQSVRHGAAAPTGAVLWDRTGVAVGAEDGRLYRPDQPNSLPPTVCASRYGDWHVVGHEHHLAVWQAGSRRRAFIPDVQRDGQTVPLQEGERIVEARIDREGQLIALLAEGLPLQVYAADAGRWLFDAGRESIDAPRMAVGTGVVAVLLATGVLRWYDLRNNQTFDLPDTVDADVTGGGTFVAALTRDGQVHILDPASGKDAIPPIAPLGASPTRLLGFVAGRPEILLLDEEGILALVDLAPAARDGAAVEHWRITRFHDADVDQVWGLGDGDHAVVRVQEPDGTATFVTLHLDTGDAIAVASGLAPYLTVDPATGAILQPDIGNAVLELDAHGTPQRVLRSLPQDAWITYTEAGVQAAHGAVRRALGDRRPLD